MLGVVGVGLRIELQAPQGKACSNETRLRYNFRWFRSLLKQPPHNLLPPFQIGDETIYFADLPSEWEGHTDRMVGTVSYSQILVL